MSRTDAPEISPHPQESGVLLLHLLDRCNLRCRHCYMEATTNGSVRLPLALVLRSLGEARQLGIRTVYVSGGEPFLYADLPAILSFVAQQNDFHVVIATNGTLIGPAEAQRLKASGISVHISIDGEESYHDHFRGSAGAFRAANRGIRELVAAGVSVTGVVTICRDNFECLPWIAEWAVRMGVERISVQPLQQLGRAAELGLHKLSEEQMCDLFIQLSDLGYAYRPRGLQLSFTYRTRSYLLAHPCVAYVCDGAKCHRQVSREIKKLVIREDGTVLPEIPTLDPRFAVGNVHDASLVGLTTRYLAGGYSRFHRLCQTVYDDVLPTFASPIVPWDEIVSERSWTFERDSQGSLAGA